MTRIVIADKHDLARAGLCAMLATEPDFAVVGEARDGAEALALCQALAPDLVLLDIRLPLLDGAAATRAIKAACPDVSVIIVTIFDNPYILSGALMAGADGYLLKSVTQDQLVAAIRRMLRPETRTDPGDLARLPGQRAADGLHIAAAARAEPFTPHELRVLRLLARGVTNREIALALGATASAVKSDIERIIRKLAVVGRTQAARRAAELGLLAAD